MITKTLPLWILAVCLILFPAKALAAEDADSADGNSTAFSIDGLLNGFQDLFIFEDNESLNIEFSEEEKTSEERVAETTSLLGMLGSSVIAFFVNILKENWLMLLVIFILAAVLGVMRYRSINDQLEEENKKRNRPAD